MVGNCETDEGKEKEEGRGKRSRVPEDRGGKTEEHSSR